MPLLSLTSEQSRNTVDLILEYGADPPDRKLSQAPRALMQQDQQPARQWSVRKMENEAPETQRVSSEPEGKGIFQEIDKHLLIVSDAAAALFSADTCSEARLTDAAPRRSRACGP
jgi:hypothetical protein